MLYSRLSSNFGAKIQIFDVIFDEIFMIIFEFWHENSNFWQYLECKIQDYLQFLARKFKYYIKVKFYQNWIFGQKVDFWNSVHDLPMKKMKNLKLFLQVVILSGIHRNFGTKAIPEFRSFWRNWRKNRIVVMFRHLGANYLHLMAHGK